MGRETYRIADLLVDVGAVTVKRRGREIGLPALSFDLLVALARHAPDAVAADELIAQVWGEVAVSDETLTQRVALLRRALGDDARRPRYVRSVRGRGYQLLPRVQRVTSAGRLASSWLPLTAAAALLGLLILIWARAAPRPAADPGAPPGDHTPIRTARPGADELVARAGVYLARHRAADNELAIELYTGALEAAPEEPRALAGLSFGLSHRATKFNGPASDLELGLELAERALALAPDDPYAHHARALALDGLGRIGAALDGYREVAALDADPAPALASAAYLLLVRGELAAALETNLRAAGGESPSPYLEVQLGATLAALGFDAVAAIWLERAAELKPDNVFAAVALGEHHLRRGRFAEAEALARAAVERGIGRPELFLLRGHAALVAGRREEAIKLYRRAREINPRQGTAGHRLLALEAEARRGDPALVERYRTAVSALRSGRAAGDEWPGGAVDEALLQTAFGEPGVALSALDLAIELGYRDTQWLLLDPLLAGLRAQPGFAARIERIRGLVDAERRAVLSAQWLPPGLLDPSAAST